MRTAIIIIAGFVVWGACIGIAKFLAKTLDASMTSPTVVFVVIWFIVAAVNMWLGISTAGFTFKEELPIFLLIFLLPVITAIIVRWKFL